MHACMATCFLPQCLCIYVYIYMCMRAMLAPDLCRAFVLRRPDASNRSCRRLASVAAAAAMAETVEQPVAVSETQEETQAAQAASAGLSQTQAATAALWRLRPLPRRCRRTSSRWHLSRRVVCTGRLPRTSTWRWHSRNVAARAFARSTSTTLSLCAGP